MLFVYLRKPHMILVRIQIESLLMDVSQVLSSNFQINYF